MKLQLRLFFLLASPTWGCWDADDYASLVGDGGWG